MTQFLLYGRTSPTPILSAKGLPLIRPITESPATIFLDDYAPSERLYLAAQWSTRSGALSGFSPIVSFTVTG